MKNATIDAPPPKHASPKDYEGHFDADGKAHSHAPKWAKYRSEMTGEFPSPFRGGTDPLSEQIGKFVARLDKLRPAEGGPAYLGKSGALTGYHWGVTRKQAMLGWEAGQVGMH